MSALLEASGVQAGYGDLEVVHGVDLTVAAGEWVALLGVPGAGKSTLLKTIAGLVDVRAGVIELAGARIERLAPHQRVRLGLSLVPEGRRLFAGMSVDENLTAGAHLLGSCAEIERERERVFSIFPHLRQRRAQIVGTLSGGEQQMCAIGRGLMSAPRLLLIDELSLGLAPNLVDELLAALETIRANGTALVVVEQDVDAALRFAAQAYVLGLGRVVLSGTAAEVRADPTFTASYMGLAEA